MKMQGWLARISAVALAAVAVFYAVPHGIIDVMRGHHYLVLVPLAMWIVVPAALIFGTWFRPGSWPPRSN